nr:tetratricopeptide repeat protein [Polycladospora coralii]
MELYVLLADIHAEQGKNDTAKTYYLQSLTVEDKLIDKKIESVSLAHNRFGNFYLNQSEFENAKEQFEKGIKLCESQKYSGVNYVDLLTGLGDFFHEFDILVARGHYIKAFDLAVEQNLTKKQKVICSKLCDCFDDNKEEKFKYLNLFKTICDKEEMAI